MSEQLVELPSAAPALLSGAVRMTELKVVLDNVLERVHWELEALLQEAASQDDATRKRQVLQYLHRTRQQLLRLLALVNWSNKAKALAECVDHDKLLDKAAAHARVLSSAADDIFGAHVERVSRCMPMFDVQTALEVLTTGGYNDLPSAIEQLRPKDAPKPKEQQAQLRRITHLIYSHLLKVQLPSTLQVASVGDGYVVLRADGLYEAKLTLVPAQEPPELPLASDGTTIPADGGLQQQQSSQADDSGEVSSGPKPQRWKWLLLGFVFATNTARGDPLQEAQYTQLLQQLNIRMAHMADSAVYKQRSQQASGSAGDAAAPVNEAGPSGPAASAAAPSASALSGAHKAGSTFSLGASIGNNERAAANRALMKQHEADPISAAIIDMHSVLSDIGCRFMVAAVSSAAQKLVGKGGRFEGHAQLHQAHCLRFGIRVNFWCKAGPLVALDSGSTPGPSQQATAPAAGDTSPAGTIPATLGSSDALADMDGAPTQAPAPIASTPDTASTRNRPYLEIGVDAEGRIRVISHPSSLADTDGKPVQLELDSRTVNIDELVLRAASLIAQKELGLLHSKLTTSLYKHGLIPPCTLKMTHTPLEWTPVSAADITNAQLAALAASSRPGTDSTGGEASSSAAQPTSGAAASYRTTIMCPVMEWWAQDLLLIKVSKNLFTGRLLLMPGPGLAYDFTLDALGPWAQKEEDLNRRIMEAYSRPGEHHPAHKAFGEVFFKVANMLMEHFKSTFVVKCLNKARQLHLQLGGPGRHLTEAFHKQFGWTNLKRHYTMWTFQPHPLPVTFPALHAMPPNTPNSLVPRGLMFLLGADHPAHQNASYTLLVCSCSAQAVPIKIIKAVPVPQQVYWRQARALPSGSPSKAAGRADAMETDEAAGTSSAPGKEGQATHDSSQNARHGAAEASTLLPGTSSSNRDIGLELEAVVVWCRKRLVYEQLLAQLQALKVSYYELTHPQEQYISLASMGSLSLPCRIARRQGLVPGHVTINSVELRLGSDTQKGEFLATLRGCFLCEPPGSSTASSSGSFSGQCGAAGHGDQIGNTPRDVARSGCRGAGLASSSGPEQPSGRAEQGIGPPAGTVQFRYYLGQGHSVMDLVTDLLAVVRMQTFLARLEMMAVQDQRLHITGRPQPPQPQQQQDDTGQQAGVQHGTCTPLGNGVMVGDEEMDGQAELSQPLKKVKLEPMEGLANGCLAGHQLPNGSVHEVHDAPGANGNGFYPGRCGPCRGTTVASGSTVHGGADQAQHHGSAAGPSHQHQHQHQPSLQWVLEGNAVVKLHSYSCNAATFHITRWAPPAVAPDAGQPSTSGGPQQQQQPSPVKLRVRWRQRQGSLAAIAPAAAVNDPAGQQALAMRRSPSTVATPVSGKPPATPTNVGPLTPGLRGVPDAAAAAVRLAEDARPLELVVCSMDCSQPLPPGVLETYQEMAEAGQEDDLLDALAMTMPPMLEVARALQPTQLGVRGVRPFECIQIATSSPGTLHCILGPRHSVGPVAMDLCCTANGTWVFLSAPSGPKKKQKPEEGTQPQGSAEGSAVVAAVRAAVAGHVGAQVHIVDGWAERMPGEQKLWVMVDNGSLCEVLGSIVAAVVHS